MTLYDPSLFIKHLLVMRGSNVAYEASFHEGVNILAGENSSGKSTILSFLVYGLGADISEWSEHAKLCDEVIVEVELNGFLAVLSRTLSEKSMQPMSIFFGSIQDARVAPRSDWQLFGYRSTDTRLSFSQQLFGMMALPELQTEVSGKITMHQLLRVHYSDQLSSIEHIFRDETFDSPALREAIGRLLFGAYDNEIYRNQLKVRELRTRLEGLNASLRSIYALFPSDTPLTLDWIKAQVVTNRQKLQALNAAILEAEESSAGEDEELSLGPLRLAFENVKKTQSNMIDLDAKIETIALESADSEIYITTLREKLKQIEDSSEVAKDIEEVRFTHCPSCFAEIEKEPIAGSCHLCQLPFDEARLRGRMLRQLASMRSQLKQSEELQNERGKTIERLTAQRSALMGEWEQASSRVSRLQQRPTTLHKDNLRQLYEESGRLQQEMTELEKQSELIERIDAISQEKHAISAQISELDDINERLLAAEGDRLASGVTAVSEEVMWFLHRDLPRQDTFQDATSVSFSFERDRISVNGVQYFSASSKVYLKNSFLTGFLFSSTKRSAFRHLRCLILDTIEDKGMELERSQNFQRLLVEKSAFTDIRHQIIFATAMIDPLLDNENYVIGTKSTHLHRTLAIN